MLITALKKALASSSLHPELSAVMEYALLPAGKMFRPKLVEALGLDLGTVTTNHLHLASAIELHHAYTLVHDDLPSMDNDLIRRGRPATHAAFGEWKAILAGDALLIASFHELLKIEAPVLKKLHRLFSWASGAKGLILGQFLDLGAKGKATLEETIRIHELKTGRLIQVATLGSYLLSSPAPSLKSQLSYFRLGREIGVSFQLLDDLSELADGAATEHEKEINPFLLFPQASMKELSLSLSRLDEIIHQHDLRHLKKMLDNYFKNTQDHLLNGMNQLEKNLEGSGLPVSLIFDFVNKIHGPQK